MLTLSLWYGAKHELLFTTLAMYIYSTALTVFLPLMIGYQSHRIISPNSMIRANTLVMQLQEKQPKYLGVIGPCQKRVNNSSNNDKYYPGQ